MERIKTLIMKSSSNPSLPALFYLKGIVNAIKPMRAKSRQPGIVKKAGWHRLLMKVFY
jgi:hypothetical protein